MKLFLIGFAAWFIAAYGIQLIKAWVLEIRYRREKKRASRDEQWIYEI